MDIADAIARRDSARAVQLARDYHRKVIKRIHSSPRAKELRGNRPEVRRDAVRLAGANVGVGSGLDRKG
jgi:hypothetical protein